MPARLYEGRPDDPQNRSDSEIRVYDLLDRLHINYIRADHEPTLTMEACRDIDETLGVTMCKNLFLCNRQKTEFYLLLLPGDKPFRTKELSAQLGVARLSFGEPEYMERFLGLSPGAVTVMGLMNDSEKRVRLLIDRDLLDGEFIGCHPCVCTSSLKIKLSDITGKLLPALGRDFTEVTLSKNSDD